MKFLALKIIRNKRIDKPASSLNVLERGVISLLG
jgi:hypothetical protein